MDMDEDVANSIPDPAKEQLRAAEMFHVRWTGEDANGVENDDDYNDDSRQIGNIGSPRRITNLSTDFIEMTYQGNRAGLHELSIPGIAIVHENFSRKIWGDYCGLPEFRILQLVDYQITYAGTGNRTYSLLDCCTSQRFQKFYQVIQCP